MTEHSYNNGETWIEGRSNQEAFVRITLHQPGTYTVESFITVDGIDIGYSL